MHSEGPFDPRDRQAAVLAAKNAAAGWGVAVPAIGVWTKAAAEQMPATRPGRWRLEFDPKLGLVSFEVWVDGSFVYGSDDIVSPSRS